MYRDSIPGRALACIGTVGDGRAAALYRQQQHMHMDVARVSGAGESGASTRLSMLISLTFLCELGQRSALASPEATASPKVGQLQVREIDPQHEGWSPPAISQAT